jgi:hypothetical protein
MFGARSADVARIDTMGADTNVERVSSQLER